MADTSEDRLDQIEAQLAQIMPQPVPRAWCREVFGEALPSLDPGQLERILQPGSTLLKRGGKRWRPLFLLLCSELGGQPGRALPLAPLVEIAHNGTLIIDDIEDRARERRGGPAIHLQFGLDAAINTGNFMYFLPTYLIERSSLNAQERLLVYRYYLEAMRRLHLGQGLDILWHGDHDRYPGVEEYLQMCRLKTGSLARLAAQMGIVAGKGSEALAEQVGQAAETFGLAFQIIDDIKNLTSGVPGKERGDDIVEGKKSLPIILHMNHHPEARPVVKELFQAAGESPGQGAAVERLIGLLEASHSLTRAQQMAEELLADAKKRLRRGIPSCPALEELIKLADWLSGG